MSTPPPLYASSWAGANGFIEVFHEWEADWLLRRAGNMTSPFPHPPLFSNIVIPLRGALASSQSLVYVISVLVDSSDSSTLVSTML